MVLVEGIKILRKVILKKKKEQISLENEEAQINSGKYKKGIKEYMKTLG